MKIYSTFDRTLGYYSEPFCAQDDKAAISALRDAGSNPQYPFLRARLLQSELYCFGDFDPCEGTFDSFKVKVIDCCNIPFVDFQGGDPA